MKNHSKPPKPITITPDMYEDEHILEIYFYSTGVIYEVFKMNGKFHVISSYCKNNSKDWIEENNFYYQLVNVIAVVDHGKVRGI